MLEKIASFTFTQINPLTFEQESSGQIIRTAAGKLTIDPGTDQEKIVKAEIQKHPNALFFRSKSIEANVANSNGDYFSEEELLKSYKTFEGVPFFTNHDNQNVENARGKVIFAEWIPEEKAVYTIAFVDRDAYPHICRSIEEEYVTGTSMGCSVEYSICNICGNRAEKTEDYCTHIRNRKGRKFTGRARNVTTGEMKDFKDELVFEYNYGLKFIENSAVVDPACPSCRIDGIISNNEYLQRVASMENELMLIKTSAIDKKASQEELDQIQQVLETLEGIAINLIKNRKQVEMEFSSDLVDIMSQLQTWLEELIGAGYGSVQGQVPGTIGNAEEGAPAGAPGAAPVPGAAPMAAPVAGAPTAQPAAMTTPLGAGTISGSPSKPMVSAPKTPITTPAKPRLSDVTDGRSIQRIADYVIEPKQVSEETRVSTGIELIRKASTLREKLDKTGELEMGKRRTISEKIEQIKLATEVLSSLWQEKQEFSKYIKQVPSIQNNENRLSVKQRDDSFIIVAERKDKPNDSFAWTYDDLSEEQRELIKESPKDAAVKLLETFASKFNNKKEGDSIMTDINKQAGASSVNATPDVVQEKQLEQKGLYHSRTNEDTNVITQKALEEKRKGEKDYLTEKQLNDPDLKLNPRAETPDVVQEAQMKGDNRLEEDINVITQKQLDAQRVNNEKDQITEKQLENMQAPWARVADRNPALFKSAADHMNSAVDVMANAVISSGCTPEEACGVAASLVDSTKNRYSLAVSIMEDSKSGEEIDYAKRVAFWSNKNLKVASTGKKEIAQQIVDGLRKIATDKTINPDVLIDAIDVVTEGQDGISSITAKIEAKLAESANVEKTVVSRKAALRDALKPKVDEKAARDSERSQILASVDKDEKMVRETERKNWEKILNKQALKNSDTVIETNFKELGCQKDNPSFRKEIVSFTKGALASQSLKLASITNVTISGDTIQIAVQTDTEENSVNIDAGEGTTNIPVGSTEAPAGVETMPEGDMTGEGLGNAMPPVGGAPAPALASSNKMTKTAQAPMGGGQGGGAGGAGGGSPEQGLPGPAPAADPIQALTTGKPGDEKDIDIPTDGKKQPMISVCPECGSNDVDVSNESGDIHGKCNACSAEYEALIKKIVEFKIIKPTKSTGEEGAETPEAPEAPEVPALPVAAQTRVDKGTIMRIAENKKKHGHVCPACGQKDCKASKESDGHSEFKCESCGTEVEKDLMVSASNPDLGVLRVSWDVSPDLGNCKGCDEEVAKFASSIKVGKLLKTAAEQADKFPMESCIERLARQYGGNTVATFGPCKGKMLAECACKELQKLGFRKVRHLNKFAAISMEKDPFDECVEEQTKVQKLPSNEAEELCNCVKERFASKWMLNIYAQAFGEDIKQGKDEGWTEKELEALYDLEQEEKKQAAVDAGLKVEAELEKDISSSLPPAKEIEVDLEVVKEATAEVPVVKEAKVEATVEAPVVKEAGKCCDKCKKPLNFCSCGKGKEEASKETSKGETSKETSKGETSATSKGETSAATEMEIKTSSSDEDIKQATQMNGQRIRKTNEEVLDMATVKMAGIPTKIEHIEKDVEAGVPRKEAYMGNEKGADSLINKTLKGPDVPRGDAYMGKEKEANSLINKELKLPDVAVDSSFMGHEQEVQKGMPGINNEIKGTVIASDAKQVKEAKQMTEVETVEKDVEAKVPRADAKMGEESKADSAINKPNKGPDVPRSEAYMGKEKDADSLINSDLKGPDVPIDNAYMGHEKEVQKDMPGINSEMLKNVQQKRDQQLERISKARESEAIKTAAWLASNQRIAADRSTFNAVVKALTAFEIDQIPTMADSLFPERTVRTAAKESTKTVEASGHQVPAIVLESKSAQGSDDFMSKLQAQFTIGNSKFDKDLTAYGEK